jgi:hypothetical protein
MATKTPASGAFAGAETALRSRYVEHSMAGRTEFRVIASALGYPAVEARYMGIVTLDAGEEGWTLVLDDATPAQLPASWSR